MLRDILQKNRVRIFVIASLLLSLLNIYCYRTHFEEHLKLRDYTSSEQLLYNPSFEAEQYCPDALIREVVRGKKVLVPRGLRPFKDYPTYGHLHDEGNPFSHEYYWENNYTKYFTEYASVVAVDRALPDLYELKDSPLPEEKLKDFTFLGPGNDMMRYIFMADHTDEEISNQFYYTWFYTVDPYHKTDEALSVNICTDGITEDDVLVALWDMGENLYLMSSKYYYDNLADSYQDNPPEAADGSFAADPYGVAASDIGEEAAGDGT